MVRAIRSQPHAARRPRRRRATGVAALALAAWVAVMALPGPVRAAEDRSGALRAFDVTFDLLLLRPLAAVSSAVGAVYFVPAAAIASPGGRDPIAEAWERFVLAPSRFAYTRPLGEF